MVVPVLLVLVCSLVLSLVLGLGMGLGLVLGLVRVLLLGLVLRVGMRKVCRGRRARVRGHEMAFGLGIAIKSEPNGNL